MSQRSLSHVHPLHLHALRAQTHLIAQRVTYTPCGRRATSKREHVARCHTSFSSKSPFVPFCHHQQVAECARVAHLGGTASNSMARLWPRRLPNVAWHMANVRCIPIKASEALATCHLPLGNRVWAHAATATNFLCHSHYGCCNRLSTIDYRWV